MKDFKNYIIGFLTATCMFLFMGATTEDLEDKDDYPTTQVGRYQLEIERGQTILGEGYNFFIFDTKEGQLLKAGQFLDKKMNDLGWLNTRVKINYNYYKDIKGKY